MQAWTRNSSVSSQALYHRATASPFDVKRKCNVVLLTQLCHTGSRVISFAACFFFVFFLQQIMLTLPRAVAHLSIKWCPVR